MPLKINLCVENIQYKLLDLVNSLESQNTKAQQKNKQKRFYTKTKITEKEIKFDYNYNTYNTSKYRKFYRNKFTRELGGCIIKH